MQLFDLLKTWLDTNKIEYIIESDAFKLYNGTTITVGSSNTPLNEFEVMIMSLSSRKEASSAELELSSVSVIGLMDWNFRFVKLDCRDPDFFTDVDKFICPT